MEPDCEFPEETMFIARKKFFNDKPTSDENIAIQLSEYFTKARVRGIYERNRDSIIKGILPRAVERHGFDISLSRVSPKNSKSQVTGENNIDRKLEQTETSNTLQLPKHGLSLDKMIQLTKKLNPDTNKELPAVSNSSAEQAEDEKKNIKYSE